MTALPEFSIFYNMAVGSAISLFLIFYIGNLILQAKRREVVKVAPMLVWLNFIYPDWLDKLTFQNIFRAFAWGLGIGIVAWTILATLFLIVITKVYSP